MTTPVLTKKQQRHSLSAKIGPAKGLRNILAQPNQNFWPVIDVNHYPELMANLNMIPPIEQFKCKIPKHIFKNLTKEARALTKKKLLETAPLKPDILHFIIMGINAVTRALEKNNVCSILLDANTDPPIIIKHIITMAVNKKIPILILPSLSKFIKNKMGFPTIAFALKQEVMQCPDNVCHPIYKSITEVFKNFELPKCLLQCFKPDEKPDENAMCKAKITNFDTQISKPKKSITVFTDVYKYRSSRDERVFIPPAVESYQVSQMPSDDFIPLDSDLDLDKNSASTSKNYRYLNIGKIEKRTIKPENTEENQSFNELKLINNKADSTKHTTNIVKRLRNNEPNYLSLKIKCIQGNKKRKKATKFVKKKR